MDATEKQKYSVILYGDNDNNNNDMTMKMKMMIRIGSDAVVGGDNDDDIYVYILLCFIRSSIAVSHMRLFNIRESNGIWG